MRGGEEFCQSYGKIQSELYPVRIREDGNRGDRNVEGRAETAVDPVFWFDSMEVISNVEVCGALT